MTDRQGIDQINSDQLDQLYDERDRAEAALARVRDYLNSSNGPCCEQVQRTLHAIIDRPTEQPGTTANNPATSTEPS
jgi:hypothetical protein